VFLESGHTYVATFLATNHTIECRRGYQVKCLQLSKQNGDGEAAVVVFLLLWEEKSPKKKRRVFGSGNG
jgi:hypothetical protein